MLLLINIARLYTISFPEHARSQVKGGHSSGEIELIQACDCLTADSTLDFQREFYACLTSVTSCKTDKQSIWNYSSKIWYFLPWNRLKTTRNSGENMYESFGLTGIQLPEKYKENFDVSSEGASTCTVSVCIRTSYFTFTDKYNLLKNEYNIYVL
jgi:hypothetical protein